MEEDISEPKIDPEKLSKVLEKAFAKWESFRKEPNWQDLDYATYVPR